MEKLIIMSKYVGDMIIHVLHFTLILCFYVHCRCPLYSDLEVIHGVAVMEEGMKAKKEVQAQNPDIELKHDPTESLGTPQ
jgi:hypothetical protein